MKYKEGYNYQTVEDFKILLAGCPEINKGILHQGRWNITPYVTIDHTKAGLYFLNISSGYAWDGATGAVDTKNFMVPSMVHDVLLEIIGQGYLPADPWKLWTDNFLMKLCKDRGMNWFRRKRVYYAVRLLGDPKGSQAKKIKIVR